MSGSCRWRSTAWSAMPSSCKEAFGWHFPVLSRRIFCCPRPVRRWTPGPASQWISLPPSRITGSARRLWRRGNPARCISCCRKPTSARPGRKNGCGPSAARWSGTGPASSRGRSTAMYMWSAPSWTAASARGWWARWTWKPTSIRRAVAPPYVPVRAQCWNVSRRGSKCAAARCWRPPM